LPDAFKDEKQVQTLRDEGISDSVILDATLVVPYFNFVNRIVLALGLEVTDNEMKGYKY
jgi:alkylhydroperoxidase family enzyme